MTIKTFAFALLCLFAFHTSTFSQDKLNIKFGKISPADFDLSKNQFDSGAAAVVIADMGESRFEGNNKSNFSIIFTHFRRAKIINKNGIDVATVEIPLYTNGTLEEKIESLKAVTYNLENGKIVETKLDDKSVFTEKASKNIILKKFTFPAVKEGSIIEFSYRQSSDFIFNLQPWSFQGEYPELWSEYEVTIPEYYNYVTLTQGYQQFTRSNKTLNEHYQINVSNGAERSEIVQLDGLANNTRFVMKNVPPLKTEKFTTTLNNHIAKIEFQLSSVHYPNSMVRDVMGSWPKMSEKLLEDEQFGAELNRNNGWLSDDIKIVTKGEKDKYQVARKIFAYVRDNFTCTNHSSLYMTNNLKTVFKNKSGSEAEINLLLAAMLNHEDIQATPVILSTRSHGKTNEIYPLLDRFNYVICAASINNAYYFLDASQPQIGFGYVPEYCYNGHARLLMKGSPQAIYLEADSIKERKATSVFIINDEKQKGVLSGSFKSDMGYYESYDLKEKLRKKSEKDYFKDIKSPYTSELEVENGAIDSLKQPDFPVSVHYDFSLKNMFTDDIVYFNPMMTEAYKENPFKAAERRYPVEMPYASDETYTLNLEIPEGYVIDEIPKSTKVLLNDNDGFFEYLIVKDDNSLQLRSRIKINKANFSPDDYNTLRDFFGFVVKKQSEQVVFKKKK
ncbi:MAG TPA: DUF3858 domain-containing protein [Puia sp.]|nr:DUF3858 domain-containing protein [Puia sp.]